MTRNWPFKIAAVCLSVLLWLRVSANSGVTEALVRTPLEIRVADEGWSLLDAPSHVNTTFRGPGSQVFAVRGEETRIVKVIDAVTDSVLQLPLLPEDVTYTVALDELEATAVDPAEVSVRLEERLEKRVPVRGAYEARAADGWFLVDMQVAPESVLVRGPASLVNQISDLATEMIEADEVAAPLTRQLEVARPPRVSVEPSTVLGTLRVEELVEVTLELDGVAVRVSGPEGVVDRLEAGDVSVREGEVVLPEWAEGRVTAWVER